ncbi:MAG TPA: shikimate dehydrogenase [Burkholderiales bacterium]
MTDRYAVIGNPVAHSKSPWIHAEFARQTRQDLDYGRIEAPLAGFARALDAFRAAGARGANVTLPFKEQAFSYCAAETSARARAAAAVNTLRFDGKSVFGDNTDGIGLVTDLERNLGRAIAGQRVLLLGAGGAARGVLQPLLERGPAALRVANRTARRAAELAGQFKDVRGGGFGELAGATFDLVINATSAGLQNEAPPLPPGIFAPRAFAYDMVYGRDTPFLAMARAAGAAASDGLGMLVEQAAESFLLWRGVRPETAPVLAALRGG